MWAMDPIGIDACQTDTDAKYENWYLAPLFTKPMFKNRHRHYIISLICHILSRIINQEVVVLEFFWL
jgi:hypothetical protein